MRALPYPAGAAAMFGMAAVVAVTPLVRGLVQLPAGMATIPASLHASASLAAGLPRFEPRVDPRGARIPQFVRRDSARDERQVAAVDDAAAQRLAPRFADLDSRRLTLKTMQSSAPPVVESYAFIAVGGQEETPVLMASLERRFASGHWSPAPAIILEPVAPEPDAFAMEVPLPQARPEAPRAPQVEVASLEAEIPQALAVPVSRPKRAAEAKKAENRSALAYANPDAAVEDEKPSDGVFGRLFGKRDGKRLPGAGSKVAVYEIESATVYMPNGEKLEAHSGLAHMKDNPRYVAEKNRGPTPPNLYDLRLRESRFHGVEAIRLLPSDGRKKYNRDGLLAHTYMYVGGGGKDYSQSNGCVVFKNYERFLAAYKRGEIEHLIVVPNLKELPTYTAAL